MFVAANKVGKSYASGNQAIACSVGYRYWEVPDLALDRHGLLPSRETIPGKYWIRLPNGLPITVPNTGMLVTGLARERGIGQVLYPVFEDLLPPSVKAHNDFQVTKGALGVPTSIRFPWGSRVLFGSSDQDPLTFEGTRLQWAGVDEPVRPFVFNGIWRGLAIDSGILWFTFTPLGAEGAWIYQRFFRPGADTSDVHIVKASMHDSPVLTPEQIQEFEKMGEWTDAERRARVFGEFETLGNRVLHNFDPSVHVIPARLLPTDWAHGMVVDPHHVRPAAVLWFKISPDGVYHFYREWPVGDFVKMKSGGKTPTEYAILFRNIEGRDIPHFRVCDPRFGKSEQTLKGQSYTCWADDMAAAGMPFDSRVPDVGRVEVGEQRLIDMLRYDRNFPISPSNSPKVLIHDCCPNLIAAMSNYGILTQRDPTKGEPEKRSEEFKDFIDAVRYAILYPVPPRAGAYEPWSDADWEQENRSIGEW